MRTRVSSALRIASPRVLTFGAFALGLAIFSPRPCAATDPPTCTTAPYDCAVALVEQRQFASAVTILERVLRQSPTNLKALNLLGIALTGAGKVPRAT